MTKRIETHRSIEGFFEPLLREALEAERLSLPDPSTAYLLQLIAEYGRREALHGRGRADEPGTPTLAWMYERARTCAPYEQVNAYREPGDVALVVSGLS